MGLVVILELIIPAVLQSLILVGLVGSSVQAIVVHGQLVMLDQINVAPMPIVLLLTKAKVALNPVIVLAMAIISVLMSPELALTHVFMILVPVVPQLQ